MACLWQNQLVLPLLTIHLPSSCLYESNDFYCPQMLRPALSQLLGLWTHIVPVTGEGNGTPLQHSCLENPMDGGAWWAAVHRVANSQTKLSDFTFTFHFHALEKEMATHSSVLAWRIPGTGEPGGLPSMGSHRVGHDWSDLAAAAAAAVPVTNVFICHIPSPFHSSIPTYAKHNIRFLVIKWSEEKWLFLS